MNRFIAAVVASAFVFGTASTFAADAAKKDELTTDQRADMRERAAKMKEHGQQASAPAQDKTQKVQKKKVQKEKHSAIKSGVHKTKMVKRSGKKTHRHA